MRNRDRVTRGEAVDEPAFNVIEQHGQTEDLVFRSRAGDPAPSVAVERTAASGSGG